MQLQLMCCALSNLSSSQFMKGQIIVAEQREGLRELEDVGSKLIFKLKRAHGIATVYILLGCGGVWGTGVPSISNCSCGWSHSLGKHKVQVR
jgi:hypothetical protein